MARTTSTQAKTTSSAPAKKTAAKKTTPARNTPAKKTTAAKKTTPPPAPEPADLRAQLPTRTRDWMTDTQGHATLTARLAGIPTHRIHDWHDHRDHTCTRALADGSHLHYQHTTRRLFWQALCPMGATHEYLIDSPSAATAARVHADRCTTAHADLDHIPDLTPEELAAYGIHAGPTQVRADGTPTSTDLITLATPEPEPEPEPAPEPRALADQLTHPDTTDTQPLNRDEIADGLAARDTEARADHDQMKGHPQP